MLDLLLIAEAWVRSDKWFPPDSMAELWQKFGEAENGFACSFIQDTTVARGGSAELQPLHRQAVLGLIARERAYLERLRKERLAEEAARRQEERDERHEPVLPDEVLARYQRYKTAYQKELYRAMD